MPLFNFETFSQRALRFLLDCWKFCVCGKVPYNLSRFVLCSKGAVGNEIGLFFLNDLTDDQKELIKNCAVGLARLPVFSLPLVWTHRSETVSRQQSLAVLGDWGWRDTEGRQEGDINALSKSDFFFILGEVFEIRLKHSVLKK